MARILVVDDEEAIREFLAECLRTQGYLVIEEADGDAALRRLEAESFDLLITDLRMPGRSGLELLAEARGRWPEMETLMITAHGRIRDAVEAMRRGAYDFLEKPLESPAQVRLMAERALERAQLRRRAAQTRSRLAPIHYADPASAQLSLRIEKIATTSSNVFLHGEAGVGKEHAARTLHAQSERSEAPFVPIRCAHLDPAKLSEQVFACDGGPPGLLEGANGGTIFLDRPASLDPRLQERIARVLRDGFYTKDQRRVHLDLRWLASGDEELPTQVERGTIRADLYAPLAGTSIHLPPLRDRAGDLAGLSHRLLARFGRGQGRRLRFSPQALEWIRAQAWPGNIRELANAIERASILCEGEEIEALQLDTLAPAERVPDAPTGRRSLAELEAWAIQNALERHRGNRKRVAAELGIAVRTLYDKIRRYELEASR